MKKILMNSLWQKFRTSFLLMHSIHMSYPCKKTFVVKANKKRKTSQTYLVGNFILFFSLLKVSDYRKNAGN